MKKYLSILLVFLTAFLIIPSFLAKTTAKNEEPYEMQKIVILDKKLDVTYNTTRSYSSGSGELIQRTKSTYGYNDLATRSNSDDRTRVYSELYTIYSSIFSTSDVISPTTNGNTDYYVIGQIDLGALTTKEAIDTYYTFRHDNPIFYYSSNSYVSFGSTLYVTIFEDYADGTVRQAYETSLTAAIGEYETLTSGMSSNYNKILAVHDYLAEHMTYGANNTTYGHNIIGALLEGEGVCEAYARTFELILNYLGIDNILVTGMGTSGNNTEAHAWNLVKLGNYYYWVDCTWDDMNPTIYTYFMKGNTDWTNHTPNTPETEDFLYALPNTIANYSISYQSIEVFKDGTSIGYVDTPAEAFDAISNQNQTNSEYEIVFDNKGDSATTYNLPSGQWPAAKTIKLTSTPVDLDGGGKVNISIVLADDATLNSDLTIVGFNFTTSTTAYRSHGYQNVNLNIGSHKIYIPDGITNIGGVITEDYIQSGSTLIIHEYNRIGLNIIGTTGSSIVVDSNGNTMINGDRVVVDSIKGKWLNINVSELTVDTLETSSVSFREDYNAEIGTLKVVNFSLDTEPQKNYNKLEVREVTIGNIEKYTTNYNPTFQFDGMKDEYISNWPTINVTGNINSDYEITFYNDWIPSEGFKLFNVGNNSIEKLVAARNYVNSHFVDIRNHFYKNDNGDILTCHHTGATETIEAHEATHTEPGNTSGVRCLVCGNVISGNEVIPAVGHNHQTQIIPATLTSNGKVEKVCSCGDTELLSTIYSPTTFTLLPDKFTYNGTVQQPTVVVKDSQGEELSSANFEVTYSDGCTEVGTYEVTVTFVGEYYSGTKTLTYEIEEYVPPVPTYTLIFSSNGGSGIMQEVSGLTGTYNLPECGYTAPEGKQFKGWSLVVGGELITSVEMTEDRIVYAEWEDLPTYTLTYNANGGSGYMSATTGLRGAFNLPANGFTAPANKQFKGWSLSTNGSIITSVDMTENKTVYAIWEDAPVQDIRITSINLTGIKVPTEGDSTSTAGISVTTPGLSINNAKWYEDTRDWFENGPATRFVAGKRYILLVVFNVANGYVLADDIDDDRIVTNITYLKSEYVKEGPDVRIYFEARAKEVPIITLTPSVKVANGVDNTLDLSWAGIANADGYKVYRSTSKSGKYTLVADVIGNMYTDTGLTYGKTYYYKVTAYNEKSSKTSSVVSGKATPNKVENIRVVSAGSTSVKISWNKVNVTGYEVYYGTSTKKMKKATTISKNGTLTYNKTKLKANTTYYFKVRAYKTVSGKKVYGDYSNVIVTKTAPSTPSIIVSVKDYKTLNVKLSSVKGATNYVLEKSTDKKTYTVVQTLPASGTLAVTDLVPGTTYYFRLKACNGLGNCSGYSKVMSKKVVPATPTVSVSSPETKNVLVNIKNQEGTYAFEIYRSTKKSSGYKWVATIAGEDELLSFLDTTSKGKTYYYKVRSVVLSNGKTVYSSYSGVKKIKSK